MSRPTQQRPVPSRERRVQQTLQRLPVYTLTILGFAALVWLIRNRTTGHDSEALTGFLTAFLTVLPFGLYSILRRAYRQMDEYGQRQQEHACTFAFVATALVTAVGSAFSVSSGVVIPLWTVLIVAALAYAAAVVRGNLSARGADE